MRPRYHSNEDRPFHLGPWPLERLHREAATTLPRDIRLPAGTAADAGPASIMPSLKSYQTLFESHLTGAVADTPAPIPDAPDTRANNVKSHAYFLDIDLAGCCEIEAGDWKEGAAQPHGYALVFLQELPRRPEAGDPGHDWLAGTESAAADVRLTQVASVLSGYLRAMGFDAKGHVSPVCDVDLGRLAVRAGIARIEDGELVAPFLKRGFRLAAVTTTLELAPDAPLATDGPLVPDDPVIQDGLEGTRPGWFYDDEASRPVHMGRFAMEEIRRVPEPTTLVIEEEIVRVPKRGDFFKRALAGDMGEKPKQERNRFAFKHPYAVGMRPLIQDMVPHQGTRAPLEPTGFGGDLSDPQRNADAIKALGFSLGADFVGICRAAPYMYYSHDEIAGKPIAAYHKYAVAMLIDQGFETMEGASGDDWISASQSMRAYMRGAEIAGIMAAHCRDMGYSARSHSNAHSEVIHNPAILMSGLAEVSRIGDTVLNPFIGPRSKSVVFTTDLPMTVDQPIDFGLQDFCEQCRKCARECPCNAITYGPKVMFNGYETWKADVAKCTQYRVTQPKGSACGRCMKMCPWNREDTKDADELRRLSIENPAARAGIIAQDDAEGRGTRNPIKRWWFDLEVIDGVAVDPPSGTNERDLNIGRDEKLAKAQKFAMFPPENQPPGGTTLDTVVPVDRKAGMSLYLAAETPADARRRVSGEGDDS